MNNVKGVHEVVYATCCRPWPVIRFGKIGKCGYCKDIPVVNLDYTQKDYIEWVKSR